MAALEGVYQSVDEDLILLRLITDVLIRLHRVPSTLLAVLLQARRQSRQMDQPLFGTSLHDTYNGNPSSAIPFMFCAFIIFVLPLAGNFVKRDSSVLLELAGYGGVWHFTKWWHVNV